MAQHSVIIDDENRTSLPIACPFVPCEEGDSPRAQNGDKLVMEVDGTGQLTVLSR